MLRIVSAPACSGASPRGTKAAYKSSSNSGKAAAGKSHKVPLTKESWRYVQVATCVVLNMLHSLTFLMLNKLIEK